jgi:uncharacterized membrane protein
MSLIDQGRAEEQVEQAMGNLLRDGVLLAAAVVLAGGILYLIRHGTEPVDLSVFRGEPADLRSPWGILVDAWKLQSRGIIQLGLLLLIATPVARVIFAFFAFLRQRDYIYVVVTVIVLAVLLYGLFGESP